MACEEAKEWPGVKSKGERASRRRDRSAWGSMLAATRLMSEVVVTVVVTVGVGEEVRAGVVVVVVVGSEEEEEETAAGG